MKLKQSSSSNTSTTVKLVPSTAINPLGTMYLSNDFSVFTFTQRESPSGTFDTITPVLSTWPCTKCPPMRLVGVTARSRFTSDPGSSSDSDVLRSVSGDSPTVKSETLPSNSVTVRHVPFTAILSPRLTPSRTVEAAILRSKPPCGAVPSCLTVPISSTMPVKRQTGPAARRWRVGASEVSGRKARRLVGLKLGVNLRWVGWELWEVWVVAAILGTVGVKVREDEIGILTVLCWNWNNWDCVVLWCLWEYDESAFGSSYECASSEVWDGPLRDCFSFWTIHLTNAKFYMFGSRTTLPYDCFLDVRKESVTSHDQHRSDYDS